MLRKSETPAACRDRKHDETPGRAFSDRVRLTRDPSLFIGVAGYRAKAASVSSNSHSRQRYQMISAEVAHFALHAAAPAMVKIRCLYSSRRTLITARC